MRQTHRQTDIQTDTDKGRLRGQEAKQRNILLKLASALKDYYCCAIYNMYA